MTGLSLAEGEAPANGRATLTKRQLCHIEKSETGLKQTLQGGGGGLVMHHKHEDLSLSLRTHVSNRTQQHTPVIPVSKKWEQADAWGSVTSLPIGLG